MTDTRPAIRYPLAAPLISVLAGLLLIPLLPIGAFLGTSHPLFTVFFAAHLVVLGVGVFAALIMLARLCSRSAWPSALCAALAAFFLIIIVLNGLVPITYRDALIHHLAVPKWWVEAGRIVPIRWHEWSNYPMLINLGYTGLLQLELHMFSAEYHFSYLLLLAATLAAFEYSKSHNATLAYCNFLLALSIPVFMRGASIPLVDIGLALYCTIALCVAYRWAAHGRKFRHLILIGLACGLALSCKYNALLAVPLFLLVFIGLGRGSGRGYFRITWSLVIIGCLAYITYLPWLLKNLLWVGNPVYPLFSGIFPGPSPAGPGYAIPSALAHRIVFYDESLLDLVLLPFRMIFFGEDDNPRRFDGVLTPVFILMFAAARRGLREPWIRAFFLYLAAYTAISLFMTSARVRYLAPALGAAVPLTIAGIDALSTALWKGRFYHRVLGACIGIHVIWAGVYGVNLLQRTEALSYIFSAQHSDEYLARHVTEYRIARYVNTHLPEDALVYLLFTGNRFYFYDRAVISGGYLSGSEIMGWIQNTTSPERLASEFAARRITHLVIHERRLQEAFSARLDAAQQERWDTFATNRLTRLHAEGPYSLWKVQQRE